MDNKDANLKEALKHSIFDDPVDLFNFNQIQPSPSLSYTKMIQASRSVPGSRRNSNDDPALDLLLGTKLSLNDGESGFSRKLPFAMTRQEPIGTFAQRQRSLDESETPLFNPILAEAKESPSRQYASIEPGASVASVSTVDDDYSGLFIMTNLDNKPTAVKPTVASSNQTTHTISPHPVPSWIPPTMMMSAINNDQVDQARRYSYGWHTSKTAQQQPIQEQAHLATTLSHSALTSMNFHREVLCPQFQQFGFCPRHDMCPFVHSIFMPMQQSSMPPPPPPPASLYQHYTMNPTPLPALQKQPFYPKKKTFDNSRKFDHQQHQQQQQQQQQDRYTDAKIEDFIGKLYEICKDQNGCRFLQKKIEEKEDGEKNLGTVFDEIHPHFIELMTDPFGNYLCQKMLEKCTHEQRTTIVTTVAPELVKIALNMHGTRAVQKLIECLSTPEQIKVVIATLTPNVVRLIKDLNGNHVIQKCLYRLSATNNQFIYNAVCDHCIEVASHKHGCCVLQRCFDHATEAQKNQLVEEIAKHALPLVQNPFGNYVVQYVLELGVDQYSESVIRQFVNHICTLSVQKFSSNVIENCIRTAQPSTRRLLIAELVNPAIMEKLLHDSFANYVVQTSLDFADQDQRAELVECIRPLLPTIRTTPYGKRIHSKIFRETKSNASNRQSRHESFNYHLSEENLSQLH
ncbi:hypothetical protein [Parasitella parasitica]|uniref:PUM-HD domain-containing protein n=1 Tax=Parasitella parasitica TaxID=35722 RepID=A0A0B7MTR8_9FUNG|nr:hypothetical protein [Parasitella parasitica]